MKQRDSAPSVSRVRDVYLGIDLGTSAVKVLATSSLGRVLATARRPLDLVATTALMAEQDPHAWWTATCAAVREVVEALPEPRDVAGIGLTGQKHALLVLDEHDEPLGPAVLWADGRARAEAEELALVYPAVRRRSGAHPLPGFLIPKWLRFLRTHPDAARRARRLVFAKDWLGLQLTGRHATDRSEASASQVYDFRSDDWAEELWQVFEMPPLRATVLRSTEIAGYVTPEASDATGLPAGVPVAAGAGDNEAAALGAGALGEGRVAVILGTSGTVVGWSLHRSPAGGLVWNRHVPQRGYAATGTVLSAGRAIDWARSTFFPPGTRMVEVLRAAEAASPSAGPLLFLPTLVGERSPVPDPDASGAFAGLRPTHQRGHLARAVLEGVALSLAEVVVLLRGAGVQVDELRLISGGAASPFWRRLIGSAVGTPVRFVGHGHGPAMGAAVLGAAAVGRHGSLEDIAARWIEPGPVEEPDGSERERLRTLAGPLRALRTALRGVPLPPS
ncbi:MAG: hypothetical protein KDB73_16135 [Planctomycetes bacterium]|nr:hypothetical protein [Planctomycetota bacterium]